MQWVCGVRVGRCGCGGVRGWGWAGLLVGGRGWVCKWVVGGMADWAGVWGWVWMWMWMSVGSESAKSQWQASINPCISVSRFPCISRSSVRCMLQRPHLVRGNPKTKPKTHKQQQDTKTNTNITNNNNNKNQPKAQWERN